MSGFFVVFSRNINQANSVRNVISIILMALFHIVTNPNPLTTLLQIYQEDEKGSNTVPLKFTRQTQHQGKLEMN